MGGVVDGLMQSLVGFRGVLGTLFFVIGIGNKVSNSYSVLQLSCNVSLAQ